MTEVKAGKPGIAQAPGTGEASHKTLGMPHHPKEEKMTMVGEPSEKTMEKTRNVPLVRKSGLREKLFGEVSLGLGRAPPDALVTATPPAHLHTSTQANIRWQLPES